MSKLLAQRLLNYFEYIFTVLALVLYSGGPFTVILTGGYSQGDDRIALPDFPIMRKLFLMTYLVIFVLLALRWKKVFYVLRQNSLAWLFLAFLLLSFLWSYEPDMTLKRGIAIVGTSAFGLYIASRYSPKEQLQILGWSFGIISLLSWVYGLLLPQYGVMGGVHSGTWRGIYTHKNTLGKMMVPSIIVFLLLLRNRHYRWLKGLGLAASVALLLLSTSKSALVISVLLLAMLGVCYSLRLYYKLLVTVLSGVALASGAVLLAITFNAEKLVTFLGKDLTLTGRTDIWVRVIDKIQHRPLLGYGYQGFWQGWESIGAEIWRGEGWSVPHAHNGFLDLCLELGLLGLSIFLIGFFFNWAKGIWRLRNFRGAEHIWPVMLLTFLVLSNLTETSLIKRNDIFWVLYVTISFSVTLPVKQLGWFLPSQNASVSKVHDSKTIAPVA